MRTGRINFLLTLLLLAIGCTHPPGPEAEAGPCGPPLSRTEITDLAEKAVEAIGGDPASLAKDHEIFVREAGCDYLLTAVPRGLVAREPISMRISRQGEVKSFPWCCPLGDYPELCSIDPGRDARKE